MGNNIKYQTKATIQIITKEAALQKHQKLLLTHPNHSCVQHQVSTAFQNQHGVYLLKKDTHFILKFVQITKHNDFQLLKKNACIYLHWRCVLCLYVGDGAKDELGLIITLLKLYAAKD